MSAIMCTLIHAHLGTFIFIMMFLPVSHLLNDHVVVKVSDPARLTCNTPCSGDVKWMFLNRPDLPVRECKWGVCTEGHSFKNRTRPVEGQPSLDLNPVMYNDQGWYSCYCDNSEICKFHLEVVFPDLKSVCVGANVTIPCYADTDKRIPDNDISVQWKKDGKPFVNLQQGKINYGPGFKGRGFITASQYKKGDLSLTITKVQQSDGGTYCCIHRHEELGQPEAVTLSIRESSECEAVKQSTLPWWGILLIVVAIVASFCVGFLCSHFKSFKYILNILNVRQKRQQDGTDDDDDDDDDQMRVIVNNEG
ncbi:uncharacterized protein LOC132874779 isoform X2 [Neoarius graeffei]|uniref:uncharacterized protein LOC132874779 isoform X2 n=1 Tax=Neoarius graeffei TaxID=443677 RepID=UPI00298BE711|nr:uncharacterized protein LOC132874779 isoform X2 [Neoarius graeffei]